MGYIIRIIRQRQNTGCFYGVRQLLLCMRVGLLYLLVCNPPLLLAADFTMETTTGYDDNPARTSSPGGSAFTFYRAEMDKSFSLGSSARLSTLVEGRYRNYTRVGDNYFLRAYGAVTRPVCSGRLLPSILAEVNAYRDDLVREDSRDEYLFGGRVSWLYSRYLTLSFESTYSRLDYKNPAQPYAGREPAPQTGPAAPAASPVAAPAQSRNPGKGSAAQSMSAQEAGNGNGRGAGGNTGRNRNRFRNRLNAAFARIVDTVDFTASGAVPELAVTEPPRDDHLVNTDIIADAFMAPGISGAFSAGYAELHSSVDFETYRQWHARMQLDRDFRDTWRLELDAGWARTCYYDSPLSFERIDYTFSAGLSIGRQIGPFELFAGVIWLKNNSRLSVESYRQTVTQCGLSWYF